ncbi:FAD-binding protein [Fervidobacterium ngatamarikiense]|uniref:FAD-binding protein n=1 Tax=Fervidobacterium pennivorans TaxID=93466 RepID=A0A172T4D8_FERPE|nr:FAD-dependent oxidoreductase [Fervidobacterium pennivorans]ANE41888.1 FAD-binding protein [Fervidobacterium pennivorans]
MTLEYDVTVFGAGLAGVSAAVTAQRLGKKVILIEQSSVVGGNATAGLVNPFMRFWLDNQLLCGDFFEELITDLRKRDGIIENCFDSEVLRLVLMEKLQSVDILFRAIPISVRDSKDEKSGLKRIEKVVVKTALGNEYEIHSKLFVDATGDGSFSYLAGCSYDSGDETTHENQGTTLMFTLANVDFEKVREYVRREPENFFKWVSPNSKVLSVGGYFKEVRKAKEDGLNYPVDYFFFNQLPGTGRVTVNTTHVWVKTTDDFEISKALKDLHKQVETVYTFAKRYVPGFENCYVEKIATYLGVRESRRIRGLYTFSEDDVIRKSRFEDGVVKAVYGIDVHKKIQTSNSKNTSEVPRYEDYYEIPLRSLISKDFVNLGIVGRNFSGTFLGQSAARIMATCTDMGEAIGRAAGMVNTSFHEIVRSRMLDNEKGRGSE